MKRVLLVLLAVVVALPLAAFAAGHVLLNGDAVRARMIDAVRHATGRELEIAGPIQLAWSLTPTIEARDVSLLNPPGMSRPATARVDRVEAEVALLPLLSRRVELRRVVVDRPDVLLERDAQGRPNWLLSPPAPPPSAAQPSAPGGQTRFELVVGAVEIRDAHVAWHGRGPALEVAAPGLVREADGAVQGTLTVNGVTLAASGTAGPFASAPWPLDVKLAGGGLDATVKGTTAQAALSVTAPDLSKLSWLAGRDLPPVRDVRATATIAPAGVSGVAVEAGASELDGGVRLAKFTAAMPNAADPISAAAELKVRDLPVVLALKLSNLLGAGPVPILVAVASADATLTASGTMADLRGAGLDVTVSGRATDLGRLGTLAGVAIPALRDLALDLRVAPVPNGLAIRGLHVTSAQGDLAGDLAIGLRPRPSLRGSLVSQRLAVDDWAMSVPPRPTPAPTQAVAQPAAPAGAAAAVADRLIPDLPVPFDLLRGFDADLHASIGEAVWRGASYRGVDARLLLQGGNLRLAPVSAQLPGGLAFAQLVADAAAQQVSVTAKAPGLAAGPVLAVFGAPDTTKGTVDLDVQLRGEGPTLRALAATLEGHLGLAMVDGEIDNRWLEQLFADAMRAANIPADAGGMSRVRCLALRADAQAGQVRLRTLALDTSRLKLDGEGTVNLAAETLDLHLKPQLRLGTALSIPVRLTGALRRPKVALDPGAIAPGRVGITIGGPAPADTCGPALALARDGQAGPAPSIPEPPSRPARPADLLRPARPADLLRPARPADLLRRLLH